MKVNVKWNKEIYKDVEVDMDEPPEVFKIQLQSLTGVPIHLQKVMGKGGLLKDESWGKITLKEGMTVVMLGTAEKPPDVIKTAAAPAFIEDLPQEEQHAVETREYGSGLVNLGNTCYANSCLQALYIVPELTAALAQAAARSQPDTFTRLSGQLFLDMARGGTVTPTMFIMSLRSTFPQFDQMASSKLPDGRTMHAQQDAEECWTAMLNRWRSTLRIDGADVVNELFGVELATTLSCAESGETKAETAAALNIKCNISAEVNHLAEAIRLGLQMEREQASEALGRSAVWRGDSKLTRLPPYLAAQVMRFYYKQQLQQRAKIFRKVTFTLQLDLHEFCADELKHDLAAPRAAFKRWEDTQADLARAAPAQHDASSASAAAAAAEAAAPVGTPAAAAQQQAGKMTGRYDLIAVITHKGRSLDGGHYIGWTKQKDGIWVQFDDEQLIPRKDEDILQLCGGGDWHTAYLLLYRAQRVPAPAPMGGSVEAAGPPLVETAAGGGGPMDTGA